MKKILGILLLLSITFGAQAQLLWKISGKGLEKPSYLFGTHHMVPISIKDSVAGLQKATNETSQVYGEVIMAEMMQPAIMQEVQKRMMLQGDTTLQSLFTAEQYEKLGKVIKENLMVDVAAFNKVKPSAVSQQLVLILTMKHLGGFNPQEQLDGYFQQQALQNNKKVGALETAQFQLDLLFCSTSLQRQAALLNCLIDDIDKLMQQTKALSEAYQAQDLDKLLKLMEERDGTSCDPLPGEMEAMLDIRNQAWIEKMPAIMSQTPTLFVVGAAHLPGANGVLELLKKQGYTVEAAK